MVALLYPFEWQHTFVTVLPTSLIDIVEAPTPYIVGILSSLKPHLTDCDVSEVRGICLRCLFRPSFLFLSMMFLLNIDVFWSLPLFGFGNIHIMLHVTYTHHITCCIYTSCYIVQCSAELAEDFHWTTFIQYNCNWDPSRPLPFWIGVISVQLPIHGWCPA